VVLLWIRNCDMWACFAQPARQVEDPVGVASAPTSVVDSDMLRLHAPPERPAKAFRWLMKRWPCSVRIDR
jgi:hypothetical protein